MAASPIWKVYTSYGEYIASVKWPAYGAMLLACLDQPGATLRYGHTQIVWTEGTDGKAFDSYDVVVKVALARKKSY